MAWREPDNSKLVCHPNTGVMNPRTARQLDANEGDLWECDICGTLWKLAYEAGSSAWYWIAILPPVPEKPEKPRNW